MEGGEAPPEIIPKDVSILPNSNQEAPSQTDKPSKPPEQPLTDQVETTNNGTTQAETNSNNSVPEERTEINEIHRAKHSPEGFLERFARMFHLSHSEQRLPKYSDGDNHEDLLDPVIPDTEQARGQMTRRDFLKRAGAVAAGTALAATLPKQAIGAPVKEQASQHSTELEGILLPHEHDESHYPEYYWGNRGIAERGHNKNNGKVWAKDWWKPLEHEDMLFNTADDRSRENLLRIFEYFNLDDPDNARYRKDQYTYCNITLGDLTRAFDIWIPHYDSKYRELVANNIYDTLNGENKTFTDGHEDEWSLISAEEAIDYSQEGIPIVYAIKRSGGRSGHVGIVHPISDIDNIYLAQSGSENGVIRQDFENKYSQENGYTEPIYAIHKKDTLVNAQKPTTQQKLEYTATGDQTEKSSKPPITIEPNVTPYN